MKYSVYKQDRYTVFQLEEEQLSLVVAPDLVSEMLALQFQGVKNLIFDASNVQFADHESLKAMTHLGMWWGDTSGVFVLSGAQPHVIKFIELTNLDRVLLMANTVQEAVELVFKEELRRKLEDKSDETA